VTVSGYENTIQNTLTAFGWRHMHVRPIFDGRKKRWVTPTTAVGWPDITAIHTGRGVVLAAEVKGTTGRDVKPTAEQLEWLGYWHSVPAAAAVVFRPSDDFQEVALMLRAPEMLMSGFGWLPEAKWRPVTVRGSAP
jgi:hypothetical protein